MLADGNDIKNAESLWKMKKAGCIESTRDFHVKKGLIDFFPIL
jgi:hypothetical protein